MSRSIVEHVSLLGWLMVALMLPPLHAATINFENLPDSYFFSSGDQNIEGFYPGVVFGPDVTGLSVTRFGGYDNSGFPPHSGDVAVWDAADPTIAMSFSPALQSFGIWYTTFDPLTLQAFDQSGNPLGTATGNPNTDGTTGTSSFLSFSAQGIQTIDLTSSAGLFVLDDLSYETSGIPEPGTVLLVGSSILFLVLVRSIPNPLRVDRRRQG